MLKLWELKRNLLPCSNTRRRVGAVYNAQLVQAFREARPPTHWRRSLVLFGELKKAFLDGDESRVRKWNG